MRKSRARRLKAKQAPIAAGLRLLRSSVHALEMSKLQQGSPSNTTGRKLARATGYAIPPKFTSVDKAPQPVDHRKKPANVKRPGSQELDRVTVERLKAEYAEKGGQVH